MKGEPVILAQDDPRIISYILKNKNLLPPSEDPYNLVQPNKDPSMGQGQYIRKLLKNMVSLYTYIIYIHSLLIHLI